MGIVNWTVNNRNSHSQLKTWKLDDLEQYGRRECLRFSGFEVKEKETKEKCDSMIKNYIRDTLKIDIG